MSIKCPYNKLDLRIACIGLEKKIGENFEKQIIEDCENAGLTKPKNQAEMNLKVADFHGILVSDLINSLNYSILIEKFEEYITSIMINLLKKKELTDIEAWAIIAVSTGELD